MILSLLSSISSVSLLVVFLPIAYYSSLAHEKNKCNRALGNLNTMFRISFDLIPQLVESVKEHLKDEPEILNAVVRMHSRYSGTLSFDEKVALYNDITRKVSEILIEVKDYPHETAGSLE